MKKRKIKTGLQFWNTKPSSISLFPHRHKMMGSGRKLYIKPTDAAKLSYIYDDLSTKGKGSILRKKHNEDLSIRVRSPEEIKEAKRIFAVMTDKNKKHYHTWEVESANTGDRIQTEICTLCGKKRQKGTDEGY